MKIFVKAKPAAREEKIVKLSDGSFEVSVKELPVQGRANRAIINALAKYFDVPLLKIRIISGHTSRQKFIEIF